MYNFVGNEINVEVHVFWAIELCVEIKVFYINGENFGIRHGYGQVENCIGGACVPWILNLVASNGELLPVWLGFLRAIYHNPSICYQSSSRH